MDDADEPQREGAPPVALPEILTPTERRLLKGTEPQATPAPEKAEPPGTAAPGGPAQGGPREPGEGAGPGGGSGGPPGRRPTLLAVEGGRLAVVAGDPSGERPVLEPGEHATVWVNGAVLSRPRRIEPGDELVVEPEVREPQTRIVVRVSDDKMQAWARVERQAGARYVLEDSPPTLRLKVQARVAEELPAPAATESDLRQALEQARVCFGLDAEGLRRVIEEQSTEPVLVARGAPPTPPEDGRLELLFEEREQAAVDPSADRIDLFERGAITWVQPGEVVAVCHPARPGVAGTNVHGEPVAVPAPKVVVLKAGKGVQISEDGRQAVATQAGRPVLSGTTVSVVPIYEVSGDAGVRTGHVRFSGDVHVRGDVLDNVQVVSGGEVRVGGLVSHARIQAVGSVLVGRTIVGSEVEAGGQAALLNEVMPVLASLSAQLGQLLSAALQLREEIAQLQAAGGGGALATLTDGELVKRLLERRFWEVPKLARRLGQLGERLQVLSALAARTCQQAGRLLVGAGPLHLQSLQALQEFHAELQELEQELSRFELREANVIAYGILNSRVEASGRIVLRGSGAFNSTLTAGRGLDAQRGVVRGGEVMVTEGDVAVRELGGSSGVRTSVSVARKGRILATVVFPNVVISVGGQRHTFVEGARGLRAYLGNDGQLVVDCVKSDLSALTRRRSLEVADDEEP